MSNLILTQFIVIAPEILLVLLAIFSQMAGLFFSKKTKIVANITILAAIILLFFTYYHFFIIGGEGGGWKANLIVQKNLPIYVADPVISITRPFILLLSIMSIVIYKDYCAITNEEFKFEFITLVLLSTVGSFVAVISFNLLLLFCSLELQALIGYVLAAFSINNLKSSEGALKYFILGALISCLSLFGISYIYGFGGSLDYVGILEKMQELPKANIGLLVGLVLFLSSLFFKLSVAPLHVWTPDVYEGSPIPSIAYFSASKIAGLYVLSSILLLVANYKPVAVDLVRIVAILSMLIGAIGAIKQTSLKRLMGYSTILNIGYVLISLSSHSSEYRAAKNITLVYMITYVISVTGFFACLIALLGKKADSATFEDLKGVAASRKALAGAITIIMFSLIGIPPLGGFWMKYSLFYQAIINQQFTLAVVGMITSVIAAYYYLKIVKSMYFFDPPNNSTVDLVRTYPGLQIITCLVVGFLLFFSFLSNFFKY